MTLTDSSKSDDIPRRKNMRSADREKLIVSEAARFFAECGFEGKTRELAKRMGVSHAVIYKHFESKDALIERVYDHVYVKRWNPEWELLILDRSLSLQDRMTQFYIAYADRPPTLTRYAKRNSSCFGDCTERYFTSQFVNSFTVNPLISMLNWPLPTQ